jgi:hypothetical protein
MALSLKPAEGVVVTVAVAGTAVAPLPTLPDNCHTLIAFNTSNAATAYLAFVPNAGAFVVGGAVAIPPLASITLALGPQSQRPGSGIGSARDTLFIDATANGTVVNLTYVNGLGT